MIFFIFNSFVDNITSNSFDLRARAAETRLHADLEVEEREKKEQKEREDVANAMRAEQRRVWAEQAKSEAALKKQIKNWNSNSGRRESTPSQACLCGNGTRRV